MFPISTVAVISTRQHYPSQTFPAGSILLAVSAILLGTEFLVLV